MIKIKKLSELKPGAFCTVEKILTDNSIKSRLRDIGLLEGTRIECVGESPSGNPKAFLIRGAVIAIRCEDCEKIIVG